MNKYEVCVTIMQPYRPEVRLPAVPDRETAKSLARALAGVYPLALIEIAHDGLRWVE